MTRTNRIALFAAVALLVALAGNALATRAPQVADEPEQLASSHEAEEQVEVEDDADGATVARERLSDAGIEADAAEFDDLAARYGVGGAVRLYAWSDATGMTVDEIAALRDGDGQPVGWGRIAKDLGVHPGIGSIMGRGNAPDEPPGLQNRPDRDSDD
ncbi:MAG TPA: hypothetical protein VLA59_02655 [Patescibacteria group bacterium]|nr:hypothetical protein [Patescibacteria group bacterium]